MAEQAAKEPTMEEILASIRRIISEDGEPVEQADGAAPLEANVPSVDTGFETADIGANAAPDDADGHLLSVDDLLGDDVDFSEIEALSDLEEVSLSSKADESFAEDLVAEPMPELDAAFDDDSAFDDLLQAEDEVTDTFAEPVAAEPEVATPVTPAPVAAPAETIMPEPQLTAAAPAPSAALTGLAGGSTVEGLVSELMKPMIKEWIDTNLPGIVEHKVEAEIQQLANKVIAALRDT